MLVAAGLTTLSSPASCVTIPFFAPPTVVRFNTITHRPFAALIRAAEDAEVIYFIVFR